MARHGILHDYGWSDRVAALFATSGVEGAAPARVVRVDGPSSIVAASRGLVRATPFSLASRSAGLSATPAAGDWVWLADDPDEGTVVVGLVPRWSAVSRKDPDDRVTAEQVLVANVDVLALVWGLDRRLAPNWVERMLAAAWDSGAVPALVLTKADVAADPASALAAAGQSAGGVSVHLTSTVTGQGLEAVRSLAPAGRTLALVGPSGAGKSSLVNSLVGSQVQATAAVRAGDQRGRHTTTSRELLPLAHGGVVIDTPGIRSVPLWDAESGLAAAFADVEELAAGCRFRDCGHAEEPGCAVKAAVIDSVLPARRLASYHKLARELAALETRRDERAWRAAGRPLTRPAKQTSRSRPGREGD